MHNPANAARRSRRARAVLGAGVPQAAVCDSAFHQTLAAAPRTWTPYPLPALTARQVRRYGFHGTSHRYVAHRWRQLTGVPRGETDLVTLHLGNGCSACAIHGGDSVDTSMGFTPLEGLAMGTRSGDVDPTILDYIGAKEGCRSARPRRS
jgi:acetate kinase